MATIQVNGRVVVAESPMRMVSEYLHRVVAPVAAMTDGQLLARYASQRDDEAFALLLRRHGPMVLGVCRRALGPTPDADDSFHATFVALARKAGTVSDCVPGWLHRVAVRTSRRALRRCERTAAGREVIDPTDPFAAVEWSEVRRLLDEELNRLPARWRTPLVLCYLDGLTRDEAARQLGWSLRTLHRRLDEGRKRLRDRLTKRGLAPGLLAAAVLSAIDLRAEVPPRLVRETAGLTTRGALIPPAIRSLIPTLSPTGALAMKATCFALVLVSALAAVLSDWQPTVACPRPVPAPPPVIVRASVEKEKPPEDPLIKQVEEAREKGIKYLKAQQKDEGGGRLTWEDATLGALQPGGPSSLAVLALLESGVKPDDVVVARGLPYLRTVEPKNTYVVSLQTQVFCKANQKEDTDRIKGNVKWLEDAAVRKGGNFEGWSYVAGVGGRADHSNTRFAVAALHAAEKLGFKVAKPQLWQDVRDLFVRTQKADGGWGYTPEVPKAVVTPHSSHTMTVAGALCLALAKDVLKKADKPADAALLNGEAWIRTNFRLKNSPNTLYNFDVIAALGRASEKKDFGTKDKKIDWYRLGAEWLLENQKPDGSWRIEDTLDRYPVVSTAFALRFLASRPE